MEREIKIQAEVLTEKECQFTVDRPVYPDKSWYFSKRDQANGSPLVQRIFETDKVIAVLVSDNVVKVITTGYDDWMPVAKQIGAAIRTQLESGKPVIAADLGIDLPSEDEIRTQIQRLVEEQINPAVAQHGGYVDLVDVKENRVFLQLGGGCQGCGMASVTLRQGIEKAIRDAVPQVGEILDVTDHAGGRNPYYSAAKK